MESTGSAWRYGGRRRRTTHPGRATAAAPTSNQNSTRTCARTARSNGGSIMSAKSDGRWLSLTSRGKGEANLAAATPTHSLKAAISAVGVDNKEFAWTSLRKGGATRARAAGIDM